jgi:hypothetical protein
MSRCSHCGCDIPSYGIKVKHLTFCDPMCMMDQFPNVQSIQQMFRVDGFKWFVVEDEE